jgi:glycosyltransferase involved in cell wall biosynthesis
MSDDHDALVLAPRFPLPLKSGDQIREYHVLRGLAERFDVTLVANVLDGEECDTVDRLRSNLDVTVQVVEHDRSQTGALVRFFSSRQPYRVCKFGTKAFDRAVSEVVDERSFDLVWVNFLGTLASLPPIDAPVVLDEHNADVRYWESFLDGGPGERSVAWLNIRRIRRFRANVRDLIDAIVSVSPEDAEEAREWGGDADVWTMPNGVDTDEFTATTPASEAGPSVVFVGSLGVRMNVEALEWFVTDAWERIRRDHPDAVFRIVGKDPARRVRTLTDTPGVTLVGEVSSVVPAYENAAVAVAPFAFGGGTKLKLLEAMAMERPIVTTPTGATGVDVADGDGVLVRDREEFAAAVAELLDDPSTRDEVGARGRAFVEGSYSWRSITDRGIERARSRLLEG